MILGIGNDIVEIARIEKAIQNESFKKRVYTLAEIELIEKKGAGKTASYAGRFSAKEAISKAMGTAYRTINQNIRLRLTRPQLFCYYGKKYA